jgi:methyl-accepting chemotaxis protein
MFSALFGNGNKTTEKPVTITKEEPTTTKNDTNEYIQHLRETKNNLNGFNKTLLAIRSDVNSLLEKSFEKSNTMEKLVEARENLHSQITELYNAMQVEETRIGSIAQVNLSGGRRRKTNRRRGKTNRRRRIH